MRRGKSGTSSSANRGWQIIVRPNGGKHKHDKEIRIELVEGLSFKDVVKEACRKLGQKDNYHTAKLYNKDGILILETDFNLIASGDILYIALKGKPVELTVCSRRGLQLLRDSGRLRNREDPGRGRVREGGAGEAPRE